MKITVKELIDKLNSIDRVVQWLDETWGTKDDNAMCCAASDILEEYRSVILDTKVEI